MDIVPPSEIANLPEVTPEQRAENDRRLAQEDSIRNAYTATFMTEDAARAFARRYKLDEDAVAGILVASRGNHKVICDFMTRLRSEKSKTGRYRPVATDFGKRPSGCQSGSTDRPYVVQCTHQCGVFPQVCTQSTRK